MADQTSKLNRSLKDCYNTSDKKIPYNLYNLIILTFAKLLVDEVLAGSVMRLKGNGLIGAFRQKPKGNTYDYEQYKKLGIKVKHKNWHTNGQVVSVKWLTRYAGILEPVSYSSFLKFKLNRTDCRILAKKLKTDSAINKYQDYHDYKLRSLG